MTILDITRNVRGDLSEAQCTILRDLAAKVTTKGSILDLCPGEGRSTVIMATAVKDKVRLFAVDTHVTNPRPNTPVSEGSLYPFLTNLQAFKCRGSVVPIIGSVEDVRRVFGKRSINLCVIQTPVEHIDPPTATQAAIEAAKHVVRKGGKVAVMIPAGTNPGPITSQFKKDFTCVVDTPEAQVFEYLPKE